ncbi:efflux RND transporter permease subunit [Escherichia coli]
MPNFFMDRPIFASVIAIIIMLAGGLAILELPVARSYDCTAGSNDLRLLPAALMRKHRAGHGDTGYRTDIERYR